MTDELDPDRVIPGDPDIDAASMLEVIAEERARAESRAMAAKRMLAPYAIRAILNGEDPRRVAALCGFIANVQFEEDGGLAMFGDLFAIDLRTMTPVQRGSGGEEGAVQKFAQWAGDQLIQIIREAYENA